MDSDAIDDEDFGSARKKRSPRKAGNDLKRKRTREANLKSSKTTTPSPNKRKKATNESDDGEDDGYEVVGQIVQAPTTGRGLKSLRLLDE